MVDPEPRPALFVQMEDSSRKKTPVSEKSNRASQSVAAPHGFPIGAGNDGVGEGGGRQGAASVQATGWRLGGSALRLAVAGRLCRAGLLRRPRPTGVRLAGATSLRSAAAALAAAVLLAACAGAPAPRDGFQDPVAIAATPDGRVWVVDAGTGEVVVLLNGIVTGRIGGSGTGDDAFLDPVDLDPTNGQTLFVADRAGGAIVRVTAEGRVAQQIPVPDLDPAQPLRQSLRSAGRGQPVAVAAAPDGGLYVVDGGRRHVVQLDAEGTAQRVLGAGLLSDPVDLAVADDGTLWVADAGRNRIEAFDRFGERSKASYAYDEGGRITGVSALGSQLAVAFTRSVSVFRGSNGRAIRRLPSQPDVIGVALTSPSRYALLTADGLERGDAVRD